MKADFGKHEWETHICGLIFNANEEPISVDICKTITEPDAAFIAACREAVPELLDENERLKKLVDDLERKNAELEDQIDELSDAAPFGA